MRLVRVWPLFASILLAATSTAQSEPAEWQIVQKGTLGTENGYSGIVDDEMAILGPSDGLRMSLVQLLLRTDPEGREAIELYLSVYKCTPERNHTSTHMILWRKSGDAQNLEMVRALAVPQMNYLLTGCGFQPIAAELFSRNFNQQFGEISRRYKIYRAAEATKSANERN